MRKAEKRQTGNAAEAAEKARKLADSPETRARFERVLKELAQSFAEIYKREPGEEEREALRSLAQVSAAFLAMADDAGESGAQRHD